MSAPALSPGTDISAETAAAFDRLQARAWGEAGWLLELRREAFARFQELGFPTPNDESWKYTNVAPIARIAWEPASPDAHPRLPVPAGGGGVRLAFVNGRWSRALSSSDLPEGLAVLPLAEVLRKHPEWLEAHLSKRAAWDKNAFTAWNTAFLEDGAFVRIARGAAIAGPIHLLFLSEQTGAPAVSHPRNVIVAESGAQASVVETYLGERISLTNSVTEISVGDGASVEHSKVQRESSDAFHVQTIAAGLERGSRFTSHNVALGAALARTDIGVVFEGEGGDCTLNGLFLGGGDQTLDTHTIIDHAKPH
nr:SufD family Fe-S cluster assembly protein [Acidobacteriota bacterium]